MLICVIRAIKSESVLITVNTTGIGLRNLREPTRCNDQACSIPQSSPYTFQIRQCFLPNGISFLTKASSQYLSPCTEICSPVTTSFFNILHAPGNHCREIVSKREISSCYLALIYPLRSEFLMIQLSSLGRFFMFKSYGTVIS